MLLSLVDSLRCPAHDEDSSLVLSVESWAGPRVGEGILGCPVCHARYRIHGGAVDFAQGVESVRHAGATVDPVRLAAQLSLTEPGGIILLTGRYTDVHEELMQFVEATLVLVDAEPTSAPMAVNFRVADRLPFGDRALRCVAVDEPRTTTSFLMDIVRCVRSGGRIVAPATTQMPPGLSVIARDDTELVGEVAASSTPVTLRRADPPWKV